MANIWRYIHTKPIVVCKIINLNKKSPLQATQAKTNRDYEESSSSCQANGFDQDIVRRGRRRSSQTTGGEETDKNVCNIDQSGLQSSATNPAVVTR